jgi:ATP-dependent Clp protease ATP-binding subunit ClpB
LSKLILEGKFGPKDEIRIDAQGGNLVFTGAQVGLDKV